MSVCMQLVTAMAQAKNAGHLGVFTVQDLAYLVHRPVDQAFRQLLSRCIKSSPIERVAQGLYMNTLSPPDHVHRLELIAGLLRHEHFNYVSLETELSRVGAISQVMFDYLCVMTTGRSGIHKTVFGTIEFTHTSKDVQALKDHLYYDPDISMFRATPELALRDLRRVGRNLDMVSEEYLSAD